MSFGAVSNNYYTKQYQIEVEAPLPQAEEMGALDVMQADLEAEESGSEEDFYFEEKASSSERFSVGTLKEELQAQVEGLAAKPDFDPENAQARQIQSALQSFIKRL